MYTLFQEEKRYLAVKDGKKYRVGDFAVLDRIEKGKQHIGLYDYIVIKSNLYDYMTTLHRKAQIIGIKDASYIIARCGIRNGSIVVEGGIGSGSMTTALLYFTYPAGMVYTYEIRKDFAEFAKENINRIPHKHWILREGDVRKDVRERNVDAFIVDNPDPWNSVEMAYKSLNIGGCFSAYVPTYNQMEKTYRKLMANGFIDLEACEIIKRGMHIGEQGTRPENVEVAHSGFLIFARKIEF